MVPAGSLHGTGSPFGIRTASTPRRRSQREALGEGRLVARLRELASDEPGVVDLMADEPRAHLHVLVSVDFERGRHAGEKLDEAVRAHASSNDPRHFVSTSAHRTNISPGVVVARVC